MTIPDWLQAIQNYMKTLQYPSSQGLHSPARDGHGVSFQPGAAQPRQGTVMAMASSAACLLPLVIQSSKAGEHRCWRAPLGKSLQPVIEVTRTAWACPSEVRLVSLQAVTSLSPFPGPASRHLPFSHFFVLFFLFYMISISSSSPDLPSLPSLTCFNTFLISHDPSKPGR